MNAQKDRINELRSAQFAAETGQTLTHFYSIDRFGSDPDAAESNLEVENQRHLVNMCLMK